MPGEKTEEATPKRRAETRRRGQVARSQDLSGVLVLLGGVVLLRVLGPGMIDGFTTFMTGAFTHIGEAKLTPQGVLGGDRHVLMATAQIMLPLLFGIALVSVAANVLQTGPLFSAYPLRPQLSRISPKSGVKRILSKQSLVTLAKSLAKLAIVGGALALRARLGDFVSLGSGSAGQGANRFAELAFEVVLTGAIALLLLGLIDLFWQRRHHAAQIRMTKEDVKDELKQSEGDPAVRGRFRQLRRDFFNRMMSAVPKADVVVTNPTHVAVALRYDPLRNDAPVVVAKGERLVAVRIKEIARANDVPIWEDQPLARVLYAGGTVGRPIPPQLFQAVAEVLAFIFRLRAGLPAQPPAPRAALATGT